MSLQRGQEVRLQEVSMREKEPRERQAVPREEEERGGTTGTNEGANDGPGGAKQATGGREHNPEGTVESAEMHPWIQVDFNEHNRANEQDYARQLSRVRKGECAWSSI